MTDAAEQAVRAYYEAIDAGDYDRFAGLLAPGVVHDRPDRTIEGREALVGFTRDDRPRTDTAHEVDAVYRSADDAGDEADDAGDEADDAGDGTDEYAVRGRLLDADGDRLFAFVDAFEVAVADAAAPGRDADGTGRIERIRTYTR